MSAVEAVAIAAAVGFVGIALFQVALALGAPFGRAAWGGGQTRLPPHLRIASAVAALVWAVATVVVLGRAGIDVLSLSNDVLRWGAWVLVGLLAIGTLMNLASRSALERAIWTPVSLVLAVLTFLVARSTA
jgi:hypothetical protein